MMTDFNDPDEFSLTDPPAEFFTDITVELVRHNAGDEHVIQAAQVSQKGENNPDTVPARLIDVLLRERHGSPFEHTSFTFFVEAPLFVFREWHRHRIASINEMSARYTEMLPRFYVPGPDRKLINTGTSMKPEFAAEEPEELYLLVKDAYEANARAAWVEYRRMLSYDIAKEVARGVLPVNIMSQMYWTVNARALMNFLSLRGNQEGATFVSRPQREIQMAAEKLEEIFKEIMPFTHASFVANGRVAP